MSVGEGITGGTRGESLGVPLLPAAESFAAVFPFHIAFDRSLRVLRIGTSIARVDDRIVPGVELSSLVTLRAPEVAISFANLVRDPKVLCVLECRSGLLLRGQVVTNDAGDIGFFLGSPWLAQADDLLRFSLAVPDFAVHDATIDLLNVAQAQRVALGDARRLATKLSAQREALRQREELLQLVIDQLPEMIYWKDASGRFLGGNHRLAVAAGLRTPAQLVGRTDAELRWRGDAASQEASDRRVLESGVAEMNVSSCFIDSDGSERWIETNRVPIVGSNGELRGMVGTLLDVSESRRAQAALVRKGQELSALTASVPGVVFTLSRARDGQLRFPFVSAGVTSLLGVTPSDAEVQASAVFARLHPVDLPRVMEVFRHSGESLQPVAVEFRIRAVEQTRWVSGHAIPRREEDGTVVWTGVLVDITAQKEAQGDLARARDEALAASRIKSEFLANMSHEIRTPMNGVIGMIGLLLDTELSERQRTLATGVQSSADALLTIINDILDFSKIEAGKLELESIPFDLRDRVEGVVELLAERAHAKGLQLGAIVARDVPAVMSGDPGRIRQVLTNLLGNAIKFTESGAVSLSISVAEHSRNEEGEFATLYAEVTDTGIGISQEAQAGLFEPFAQGDGSITRRYGGTGLGLAISSQLVRLMKGEIGVRSEPGRGSTFWFTVPLRIVAATPAEHHDGLHGRRVLIVDDHPMNRRVFREQLRAWGVETVSASGSEEALSLMLDEATAGHPFDAALLDMRMPGMNGVALAHAIRQRTIIAETPLILLTSWQDRDGGDAALFSATLTKPVRSAVLRDSLARALATRPISPASAIRVESPEVLPRGDGTPREVALERASPSAQGTSSPPSGPRVLLVEDNVVNQFIATEYLKRIGAVVTIASDGREAIGAFERGTFDVILMDCQMPGLDGFGATRAIRDIEREDPARRRVAIIALTANAMRGDRERCLDAGMDDYLSKPLDREQLLATIDRWIGAGQTPR